MAIVSVELDWNGAVGRRTGSSRAYEAHYKLITDDPLDGPQTIADHFESDGDLPYIHDEYDYGNDRDPAAFCIEIDPRRVPGSATRWLVVLRFETPGAGDNQEQPDANGKPTSNPTEWLGTCEVSHVTHTIPAETALFLGGINVDGVPVDVPLLALNKRQPVQNAALQKHIPTLEKHASRMLLRFGQVRERYPGALFAALHGAVNGVAFEPPIFQADRFQAAIYTVFCADVGGALIFADNRFLWRIRCELLYDRLTWIDEVPNRGTIARCGLQNAGGYGGGAAGGNYDRGVPAETPQPWTTDELSSMDAAGIPRVRETTDIFGKPVEVNLNEVGGLLAEGQPQILLRWLTYPTADLRALFGKWGGPFNPQVQ